MYQSFVKSPPAPLAREWTKFEMTTVLSLICKGDHKLGVGHFTDMLNRALNSDVIDSDGDDDDDRNKIINVDHSDVGKLLRYIETHKKGALEFIERQPAPMRITRMKRKVFERVGLDFIGSTKEWTNGGRRDEVMKRRAERLESMRQRPTERPSRFSPARRAPYDEGIWGRRGDGVGTTFFTNTSGVQVERWARV